MLDQSETVYKVVAARLRNDDTVYYTSCMMEWLGDNMIEYVPGKKTYPFLAGSYLWAFDTQEHAEAYLKDVMTIMKPAVQFQIWEAEANIVATSTPQAWDGLVVNDFWAEMQYALKYPHVNVVTYRTPGSIWVEWLTMIDRVWGFDPDPDEYRHRKKKS